MGEDGSGLRHGGAARTRAGLGRSGGHRSVLIDERWRVLAPLIDAVRPSCGVPHRNLRRTIAAILWRHQNGAKWRSIPLEFGPWWTAAQTFLRWGRLGVWERLLEVAQRRGVALGMVFLDGTAIRAHQKAAGAQREGTDRTERDRREALGRSRGGYGTKACVIAEAAKEVPQPDTRGRARHPGAGSPQCDGGEALLQAPACRPEVQTAAPRHRWPAQLRGCAPRGAARGEASDQSVLEQQS